MLAAPIGIMMRIEVLAPRLDGQMAARDPDILRPPGGIILQLSIIPALAVAGRVVTPSGGIERIPIKLVRPDEACIRRPRHRLVDPVIVRDRRRLCEEQSKEKADGRLMVLATPTSRADPNPLIASWGMRFTGGLVIDPARSENLDFANNCTLAFIVDVTRFEISKIADVVHRPIFLPHR